MAMRKSTRQELRKLREMVRWAYADVVCCFCHEPLLSNESTLWDDEDEDEEDEIVDAYAPGDGESSPMNTDVTLHHLDGDHSNNLRSNHAWAHRRCHKSHHLAERHADRKAKRNKKTAR